MSAPNRLTKCRRFFEEPTNPKQRIYEALRARFLEGRPSHEVARAFGYTPGSFRVLCHQFRREPDPQFFLSTRPGPKERPKKSKSRDRVVALRKQNFSVYDISAQLKAEGIDLKRCRLIEGLYSATIKFRRRRTAVRGQARIFRSYRV